MKKNETNTNNLQESNSITYFTKTQDTGISYEYPCAWSESSSGARWFNDLIVSLDEITNGYNVDDTENVVGAVSKANEQIIKEDNEFGYKIIEPLDMVTYMIDGEETGTFLYSKHGTEWRRDVITIHNDVIHTFTFSTLKSFYEEDLPVMNHIINSIKWLD